MKLLLTLFTFASLISLSGCAAGSATAAFALRAQTADSLTVEGEARLIERARQEILRDLNSGYNYTRCPNQ